MANSAQRSFAGGELAPSLHARTDQAKYHSGLRTCRNFVVQRHGGVTNRPGTQFIGEVKVSGDEVRLAKFHFNDDQTYVFEFGNLYVRIYRLGARISVIGAAAWSAVTTYLPGDVVLYAGTYYYQINAANSLNNQPDISPTWWYALSATGTTAIVELLTPYVTADLAALQFVQSADVVTIVHPSYAPRELKRFSHTRWNLSTITFGSTISAPAGGAWSGVGNESFGKLHHWFITAISATTGEESLGMLFSSEDRLPLPIDLRSDIQVDPGTDIFTMVDHGRTNGVLMQFRELTGAAPLAINTNYWIVEATRDTFKLSLAIGGAPINITSAITAATIGSMPVRFTWNQHADALEYLVYRSDDGVTWGRIGVVAQGAAPEFLDEGQEPDFLHGPPISRSLFNAVDKYPSAVTYFQQRRFFANSNLSPETIWSSEIGLPKNFNDHFPVEDDHPIIFTLLGREVNEIRHLIDVGKLFVLTSGGEWVIEGDEGGIILPGAVNAREISYHGSAENLSPLVVGDVPIYVQARGSIPRTLIHEVMEGSRGTDLSVFAAHLFDGYTVKSWDYAETPNSIIWAARSDGKLLGLTYMRDHEVWGWHRHDTDGSVEQVCVVPEGLEDRVYLVVRRTIGGQTKRYVERMASRSFADQEDAYFIDSGLSYDGWNVAVTTMTLSGGVNWTFDELLTITASAGFFVAGDVGNAIHLRAADGTILRVKITAYTSATVVKGFAHKTVPDDLRNAAKTDWAKAVDEFSGLGHLEGKKVAILADGHVVASPNNDAFATVTVTGGAIALDRPYAVVHAGLPYLSDLETLEIDSGAGSSLRDRRFLINQVGLLVEKSRGIWIGQDPPADDAVDPLEGLAERKPRASEDADAPPELVTDKIDVIIETNWGNGRVFIRQVDPVPLTVLAAIPQGAMPGGG